MSRELEACFLCEGTGKDLTPKHLLHPAFRNIKNLCVLCEGTGKLEEFDPNYTYKGDWFD